MEAFTAVISGRVQMVMFRDFVQRKASLLEVRGEVENMEDGTVRVYAEGEKRVLEKLILLLKKGPALAHVGSVEIQWGEPQGEFKDFSIHY